jgi:hypothetical protein
MARVSRTRSRTLRGSVTGSVVRTGGGFPTLVTNIPNGINLGTEFCEDRFGPPWFDSPLDLRRGVCPWVTLNGVRHGSGGLQYQSIDVPLHATPTGYMRTPYAFPAFTRTPMVGLAELAVANANPNTPDIDIPVSIAELRELPSLLRESVGLIAGKLGTGAKASAKANILAQFGIAPIIRDLVTMFDFAKLVNDRERYLRELAAGNRRIKRRLAVESWEGSMNGLVAFSTVADNTTSTNKVDVTGKMFRTYWYTMRASLVNPPSEREIRLLAPSIVLGTNTVSAVQVWNLIPWSWLIDWFTTTGTLMASYRGGLTWQWSNLNVMYQTDYYMAARFPNPRSGFTYTPQNPNSHAVTKVRVQPAVSFYPRWKMPYLTGRQLSILSSLVALRL